MSVSVSCMFFGPSFPKIPELPIRHTHGTLIHFMSFLYSNNNLIKAGGKEFTWELIFAVVTMTETRSCDFSETSSMSKALNSMYSVYELECWFHSWVGMYL